MSHQHFQQMFKHAALAVTSLAAMASSAVTIPNTPLVTQITAKPLVMLVAGKDHKMFYEAYNDSSDIDGDGNLDTRFKPGLTYYGLYDAKLCYSHNGKSDNTGLFTPTSIAAGGKCSGYWSGNWLNYMTTSRIDALRKVLYGGHREVDTATQTILRRAYIPQDAHSWGKEFFKESVDGYKISDYTPLSEPATNTRHFFGTLTANKSTSCATLKTCSDMPPLLRIRENVGNNARIWQWASKERPILDTSLSTGGFPAGTGAEKNYTIRVEVCKGAFLDGCKEYPNGAKKPIGLLHDYGENESMLFGLLTGSYDKHMSGGRLRKVVSAFVDNNTPANGEVDLGTGQFTAKATIVNTFNNLRIRGFNQSSSSSEYWKSGPYDASAKLATEGEFVDWGNPIGEMMYEATRYFAGKNAPITAFAGTATTIDTEVGLSSATWDDPYSSTSAAKASVCARANFLTISDVYPSFDSDSVPGSYFNNSFSSDLTGLDVKKEGDDITSVESTITGQRFIGQSNNDSDSAPTAKAVTSLGTVRGLAPGEPAKQGSYYTASVASYANRNDLRGDLAGKQSVTSYMVGLTSPLPKIEIPLPGGKLISLVPFSKTINHGSIISAASTAYQPTNQIVDFYVEKYELVNGSLSYAKFIINYEDVEQGGDHDMDAIAEYEVQVNSSNQVVVKVTPTYQAGGMKQNMGYVISGTSKDGVYLVAQDEPFSQSYFLNVPSGHVPGDCNKAKPPNACKQLPTVGDTPSVFTFTASSTPGATLLDDPLRYAAKWGGFKNINVGNTPDLTSEWDADNDGVPDTYFLVQNPLKLKDALKKAFDNISDANSSASNVLANSTSISDSTRVFQARFNPNKWSGDLVAYPINDAGVGTTPNWTVQEAMPAPAARQLFVRTTEDTTVSFDWASLPAVDKALLDANTSKSQNVLDYLRGVRSKEIKNGGALRDRIDLPANVSPLGDIVHSSPFYEKDNDMLFVSANDGMLHAFRASAVKNSLGTVIHAAGSEVFGFIPSEVLSRLKNLAYPGYSHDYYVDGDVVVSPKTTETGNKLLLVAALGRGGKGLFGLNVTTPNSFSSSDFLWEYTPTGDSSATTDGVLDTSTNAATDQDLGFMLGRPIYAKLNNDKAAIIVGNGYNSTSGKAVLYIFILNTAGQVIEVKKLDTLAASDNGLATPGVFDTNADGKVDYIYAGDLHGNVWKFDVSSNNASSWSVALSGSPLFVAKDASDNRQPITAQMTIVKNEIPGDTHLGKRFVFFGSGSYFRFGDPAVKAVQSWYGIIDENAAIVNRNDLQVRTVSGSGSFAGKLVRTFSTAVTNDMAGKKGWYIDFIDPPPSGERMVTESMYLKLVKPALVASSIIPAVGDPCIPGGTGYINVISPFNGASMTSGILDVNDNKNYSDDLLSGQFIGSLDLGVGMPSRPTLIGNQLVVGGTKPTKPIASVRVNAGVSKLVGRISWREIVRD